MAGRLQDRDAVPFFRFLFAAGLALVGYISFVNLVGQLTHHSIPVVIVYLVLNAAAGLVVAGVAESLEEAVILATSSIDEGHAAQTLDRWIHESQAAYAELQSDQS